ncbi:MAG: T9SS type A sorting domain-containing protein, partial [Saprospiraceae bacterium]|nr:T9SS type A sorting domain-containing protein [Saprospiraceae bacterium]
LTNLSAAWYTLGGAVILQQPGESFAGNTLNAPFKVKQYELGAAPIQISFEALTANILGFSTVMPIIIQNFESESFAVSVALNGATQTGESIRFVALAERNGQIHSDTFETTFNDNPFTTLFEESNELANAYWISDSQWGQTTEQAYSPSKSMTDSPLSAYTAEVNMLTTALPLSIPDDAYDARLRFFARWDIEPELDWATVSMAYNADDFFFTFPGILSKYDVSLAEDVYAGSHSYWEEECIDLESFIGESFFLRFTLTSFSGNPDSRDGFYFDDLVIEYKTDSGVFTLDIPDAWNLQSRPNPAADHTLIVWDSPALVGQKSQMDICTAEGQIFRQISLSDRNSNTLKLETGSWPAGLYFYRLTNAAGNSLWRKLVVTH